MENKIAAEGWFQRAEEDLKLAKELLSQKKYIDHICFNAQQAAEKYLKGLLVFNGKEFEKVHNLGRLLELAGETSNQPSGAIEGASVLSSFYVRTRYPFGQASQFTYDDAVRAVEYAEGIKNFVLHKFK